MRTVIEYLIHTNVKSAVIKMFYYVKKIKNLLENMLKCQSDYCYCFASNSSCKD